VREEGKEQPGSKTAGADNVIFKEPTEEVYVVLVWRTSRKM
jgi:hypothetical protein